MYQGVIFTAPPNNGLGVSPIWQAASLPRGYLYNTALESSHNMEHFRQNTVSDTVYLDTCTEYLLYLDSIRAY